MFVIPAIAAAVSAAAPAIASAGAFLTSTAGTTALIAGSTALSAYGAYQQGQAEADTAAYQRRVAKNNAALADQNAEQELFRSQIAQQRQDWDASQQIADVVADQSGTGLSGLSGSKFSLIRSLSDVARLDAANVRNEGVVNATNLKQQAFGYRQEAQFYKAAGSNARRAGTLGVLKSFLGGAQSYNTTRAQGLIT
jgi:hypothetical protein